VRSIERDLHGSSRDDQWPGSFRCIRRQTTQPHLANIIFSIPLAKQMPGLRKLVSRGQVFSPAAAAPYHLMATLHFDSVAAIKTTSASAEGKATAADTGNFANGGVDLVFFESGEV
jgi:uncharacterized protein (TIGR02118 family)